ncbi:Glutamate--tRNA ligase [Leptothrix cholodnii SP-6]|uniref:Glutamyl-Q tRNA(Asp) synthetase n=1 Tax=Leptothrix cholodnii (strain ATCC 51168 / LMG 8142 / SP-6) TaxID=395495 RepID=GLUQ_LEPCP|nr:tRNA glutamyl-Q(34) synthetase GluQRS [Leptothrix cholodnii]B1Y0I4.1 RecName: Full=Glutamyl-Q tRNA(Asp) synthetase; Short=Glu-Q-RSs [Leptothrix cholodnii SP-6]ACB32965.1 Glutamate--tRNA ligase [Leptothrix cholodnii SP-6]
MAEVVTGRFAPSPTGALHAGSMVAALASWLDVRAQGGVWLVRMEDVDTPRCVPGAAEQILSQLAACGLNSDRPPMWQSSRGAAYGAALAQLVEAGLAYPCACTRKQIEQDALAAGHLHLRQAERVYPGTCRPERGGLAGRAARAWRLHTARAGGSAAVSWSDRRLGRRSQGVEAAVGDFVLRRADGLWAYQLAVVVDDAAQGITDVVRGEDLADNTARQILLQRALGLPMPRYLHTPLVLAADGQKLSKQNGAVPVAMDDPAGVLRAAAAVLGLTLDAGRPVGETLAQAVALWRAGWLAR